MVAKIQYFNVVFCIFLESDMDISKYSYLARRIAEGECLVMKDIYGWCHAQKIDYTTHFYIRKDYSILANLWNLYNYARAKIEMEREKRGMAVV